MEDLPALAGTQPAELRQLEATLSLANRAIHDPNHVLHGGWLGSSMCTEENLDQDAHLYLLRGNY